MPLKEWSLEPLPWPSLMQPEPVRKQLMHSESCSVRVQVEVQPFRTTVTVSVNEPVCSAALTVTVDSVVEPTIVPSPEMLQE